MEKERQEEAHNFQNDNQDSSFGLDLLQILYFYINPNFTFLILSKT